jgi:nanoRNase/pAp phosphatase (c-di-AMP/oligoRNAs hydrolase)|uniref:Phosphoethanolamine methyltransferase n=1 Tax=Desulfobacca acetoxidans TaxID=60893 RepID=A0A7C5AMU8_9BACT
MRQSLQRLYQLFVHEDRLLILIDADPDSMASAWALKRLLWHRLSHVVISHVRPITRPQNERMVRLLGLPSLPYSQVQPEDFNRKALVDSQPAHHPHFAAHSYDLIIDHHPLLPDTRGRLVDIRPHYGATATILTEYLRAARIRPSIRLATALYYGIKTDTSNFERPAIEADVRAFHFLFHFIRKPLVRKLEYAELTLDMLNYFQVGLKRFRRRGNRLYTFLGPVPSPDILVILADFFLRLEDISWTIVGGLFEDKLVVIFRNDGLRKNAGRLAVKAFGRLGSAGGHAASARAEVPLDNLKGNMPQWAAQWQTWQDFIIRRVEG